MKKIILSVAAFTVFIVSANAQIERKHNKKAATTQASRTDDQDDKDMKEDHPMGKGKMNFSDDQKKQMKSIQMDYKSKMDALDKNDKMSVKDYNLQKETITQERKSKIEALLTPEQKSQFAQHAKDQHMQQGENKGDRMEKIRELGLSKDQMAKLKEQRQSMRPKMQAINNDKTLSAAQKQEKIKALKESNREFIKSILTPEQMKKLEEQKNNDN